MRPRCIRWISTTDYLPLEPTGNEEVHGVKPVLNELCPFACRGFALTPVQGKSHKSRSQQVMWIRKDFKTIGGARFYHPSTISFGTSGHVKWYPGMWYDSKFPKYDISAQLMGEGCVEDYQYLVGTTHFDEEDGLLYVTQTVYEGRSPVGKFIVSAGFRFTETV